jgi:hypothetical protein
MSGKTRVRRPEGILGNAAYNIRGFYKMKRRAFLSAIGAALFGRLLVKPEPGPACASGFIDACAAQQEAIDFAAGGLYLGQEGLAGYAWWVNPAAPRHWDCRCSIL